jgi:hypothetical protein
LFEIVLNSDGTISSRGGTSNLDSTTDLRNSWNHFAYVKSSNTLKLYINGTEEGSVSDTTTYSPSATPDPVIGAYYNGTVARYNGYLSDFRITKSAVYTSNFTAPTERLTAIANTSLLTFHLPYLADGSTNSHAVTMGGRDHEIQPFAPYDSLEYVEANNGGSIHYDDAGDYLTLPTVPTLGTSDFEISMWLYPETRVGDDVIIDFRPASTNGIYVNLLLANGIPKLHVNGDQITGSSALPVKVWSYLTLTRVSNSTKLYVNGTQTGSTYSDSNNYLTGSSRPVIGQAGYNPSLNLGFNGYMSDLVVKLSGNSAPSVPTTPVSSSGSTLHVKGTDASIIDNSQTGNIKVFGTATGSSTEVKFANTKSMYFPGTNSHHMTHYSSFYLPGELTIECWVNTSTFNAGYVWCLENYQLEMRINSNGTGVDVYDNGYINFTRAAGAMSTGTWYHIAVCRDSSNVFRVWIDGVRSSESGTKTTTYDKDHIIIGGEYASATTTNWPYHGYVQDLRVSNYARYSAADETANIPTEPLKG